MLRRKFAPDYKRPATFRQRVKCSSSLFDFFRVHLGSPDFVLIKIKQLQQFSLPCQQFDQPVFILEWTIQFTLDILQPLALHLQLGNRFRMMLGNRFQHRQ